MTKTKSLFGTDGIRGRANAEPMTASTALKVAQAAAHVLNRGDHRHKVVIGKDTRLSGYMLEPALTAGFIGMGYDVFISGPLPTPAIAMLTRSLRADLGVVISASHNPYEDNGIKFFSADGYKLSDEDEAAISAAVLNNEMPGLAEGTKLGRAKRFDDGGGRYIEFVKNTFPKGLRLDGLKIVVDCAHGAAYKVAPTSLWELGAEVIALGVAPDGRNINAGFGATAPKAMCEAVVAHGADLGIALDGDADRVILADEHGHVIDGDQVMALIARAFLESGKLSGGHVVATVMSNLGLERFVESQGIGLHRTPVGDRHVVEAMRRMNCNVGGEQSGHIVLSDYGTTGDGLIAALQVLAVLKQQERKASEVLRVFQPVPQKLVNIRVADANKALEDQNVKRAIQNAEASLKGKGRLLVRKSGTEPLVRVMAEADDEAVMAAAIEAITGELGRVA